ncbi:MAG: class E sortase [Acidimicrobiia bacterium]|nr:class E sortase [Acidimicrobiia bacterium]
MQVATPTRCAGQRRRTAALLLAACLLGAACGTDEPAESAATTTEPSPVLQVSETTVAPTTTTEPGLPALPVPGPLPLDAHADEPLVVLGRMKIPSLGVDEPFHQGMTLTSINHGPSQWPGTALPGQLGNMVVAGHRTTYSRPFHDLDLVAPGDEMIIETTDGERHVYVATGTEIVDDEALWIADQSYGFTATTFACHPKGSARERIVVRWQLVDDEGEPIPALA